MAEEAEYQKVAHSPYQQPTNYFCQTFQGSLKKGYLNGLTSSAGKRECDSLTEWMVMKEMKLFVNALAENSESEWTQVPDYTD